MGSCQSNGQCPCIAATCASLNAACGVYDNGCGQFVNCGTCGGNGDTCNTATRQCECNPLSFSEVCTEFSCGRVSDGCNGEHSCGSCTGDYVCEAGECVTCSSSCSIYGYCDTSDLTCKCNDGYTGDGTVCNPQSTAPGCSLDSYESWNTYGSTTPAWSMSEDCSIYQAASATSNCPFANGCFNALGLKDFNYNAVSDTIVASITRLSGSKRAGIFLRGVQTSPLNFRYQSLYFDFTTSRLYQGPFSVTSSDGSSYSYSYGRGSVGRTWNVGQTKQIKLQLKSRSGDTCTYALGIDTSTYTISWQCAPYIGGTFGLLADGPVRFSNVGVVTQTRVFLQMYGCMTDAQVRNYFSNLLGISTSQISDIESQCIAKRQSTLPVANPVSFVITGGDVSAAALATKLENILSSGYYSSVQSAGTPAGHLTTAPAPGLTPTEPALIGTTASASGVVPSGAAGGASGLSGGAIAGIVIGAVAALALFVGAAVLASGLSEQEEMEESEKPTGMNRFSMAISHGIPVMNQQSHIRRVKKGRHQSVTARSDPV